jgi:hypothetical protein
MPGVGALPRSLVQPFRKNELIIGSGWRCYFAPYNIALGSGVANTAVGPTNLDLSEGPFDSNNPQNYGFVDLGWIKDFKLTPESKIGQVRSGYRGAIRAQYRGQVGESFEFKFREYGRLQYRIATGTNVLNLLGGTTTTNGPVGASGAPSVLVTAYASGTAPFGVGGQGVAPTLTVAGAPSSANIAVNSYIVCDQDYNPATYGIVGDAGTPVFQNAVTDTDYIRMNSDYVSRVTAINGSVLTLDQPFVGGGSGNPAPIGPGSASNPQYKVQVIVGWAAREGGTFISEWSALFLMNTIDNAQIAVYYPHVSIVQNRDVAATWAIENVGTTDLGGAELDAQYQALAFDDPLDGETVVGYKAFYPRPQQNIAY